LATVSSTLAFAQNAPLGTDAPNRSWEPKGAFAAALMPVVVNSLTDLFRSWFQLGVDKLKPGGTPSGSVNGMNAGDRVSPGPNNPGQVQPSRTVVDAARPTADFAAPAISTSPAKPTITAAIKKVDEYGNVLQALDPDSINLVSKDRFVIQVRTNVPGVLLTQNKDPLGTTTELDRIAIGAAVLNVLPADETSYELDATSGTETFRLLFQPCLTKASALAGKSIGSTVPSNQLPTQAIHSAEPKGAKAWGDKAVIKTANQATADAAQRMLQPATLAALSACNPSALLEAAKTEPGTLGSYKPQIDNTIVATGADDMRIVELVLKVHHAPAP